MIDTIEGKFVKHRYCLKKKNSLQEIPFREAMNNNIKSFLSEIQGEEIAISVWTTPKRTKTPPWGRVYDTLSYTGKKVTIIPVQSSYGKHGDPNIIQPSTISWLFVMGDIYVIIGVYVNAKARPKGKSAKNKKRKKPSTEGEPVFTKFEYDLDDLEKQITEIITKKHEVRAWNESQIKKIPHLLEKSIENNIRLGKELGVITQSFKPLKKKLEVWKKDHDQYLDVHDKKSRGAQNREFKSQQKYEKVPGKKGKVEIDVPGFPKLHLTADSMEIDSTKKIIKLLEGKNTEKEFNTTTMVLEQHVKLIVFKNTNFRINNEEYDTKLISYLTDAETATKKEIHKEYEEIIQDNNANGIKFLVNNKIIK